MPKGPWVSDTFTAGVNPASMVIDARGRFAYVANSNHWRSPGVDSVSVLDLARGLTVATIYDRSFNEPYRLALSETGHLLYVTNSASPETPGSTGTVSVVDVQKRQVVRVIRGFDGPTAIGVIGRLAYVSNYGASGGVGSDNGDTVTVVDLVKAQLLHRIPVAPGPVALVAREDLAQVYVISYVQGKRGTGVLAAICRRTNRVVAQTAGLFGPFGLAVTPCGKYALVTNFGSNDFAPYGTTVSVVHLASMRIVKNLAVGIQPSGVAVDAQGRFAYVSNYNAHYAKLAGFGDLTYGEGTVNIICLRTWTVVAPTVPVGQTPSSLTLAPDGRKLYVCKYAQGTVSALSLDGFSVAESGRTLESKRPVQSAARVLAAPLVSTKEQYKDAKGKVVVRLPDRRVSWADQMSMSRSAVREPYAVGKPSMVQLFMDKAHGYEIRSPRSTFPYKV